MALDSILLVYCNFQYNSIIRIRYTERMDKTKSFNQILETNILDYPLVYIQRKKKKNTNEELKKKAHYFYSHLQ